MTLRMRIWTAEIWSFLLAALMRMILRMRIWTAEIWTFLLAASFILVFESTAYLKFAKLQYVSSAFVAG